MRKLTVALVLLCAVVTSSVAVHRAWLDDQSDVFRCGSSCGGY